ncbi:serine protease [Streptomyces sp. NPDC000987]|uniref:serine protease n=1 Tax=Streptomyces sp. NPDC000987 TaxID=3154374 RepID=UPI00331DDA73
MAGEAPRHERAPWSARPALDAALARVHDLAGRPRGTAFAADRHGTLITAHEAVGGLPGLVLRGAGDRRCRVTADAVTALPALGLALVRTEGLGLEPLPLTVRDRVRSGTYVSIAAGGWREARVLGATPVTYPTGDRLHHLGDVLELAVGTAGRDALRPGGGAAGGPVLDAATGAVVGVLGTVLRSGHRDTGFAVPPRAAGGPLAALLAENAATVPAYGADLNLAGVLHLTAAASGPDAAVGVLSGAPSGVLSGASSGWPVERDVISREFAAFTAGPAAVLGLVSPPGSGRTTELAALAARRTRGAEPAPTLWLRGADLRDTDASVADAAHRALVRAVGPGPGDATPARLAHVARAAGRPLLILLDDPEEAPPALFRRLSEWAAGTARWLRETGARLVVACRAEHWEEAGARFPRDLLHRAAPSAADDPAPAAPAGLPPCVHLGDLTDDEARRARALHGIPEGTLRGADARHPLTLRLLSEVRAALPDAADAPRARVDRDDVLSAHLDLMCLRVAVRLAAANGLRGPAVRRLAARVAGQVHEAARRSLGSGRGTLDRASFEAVFPPDRAPARLGGGTGWASAVLAEGLLVPAGSGYRFAHEETADWLQGMHLDLDEALHRLVHHRTPPDAGPDPVPRHRAGPVVEALLFLGRRHGTRELAARLAELADALDDAPDPGPHSWWAARLLAGTLRRVPDATPYAEVLRRIADRIVAERPVRGTFAREFGPGFWSALPVPEAVRFGLLRTLVLADGPAQDTGPRFLDTAARLLAADLTAVQPLLVRWFDDDRPLPATPHASVADAAQALLHTHRRRALDELTEVLAESGHRRADQLLGALARDEPSGLCRAVDRWAHDERPARRAAAVTHGLRAAPHLRTEADRALLRYVALALLARPADRALHGGALALLVRDPHTRSRHLAQALRHFAAGDPSFPPDALAGALTTHPAPVLDAFRARLRGPHAAEALRTLVLAATPPVAHLVATLLREAAGRCRETAGCHPETTGDVRADACARVCSDGGVCAAVAAHVDRRLDRGPAARAALLPLVTGLLDDGSENMRTALAAVLAVPGAPASRPLRRELLDVLLAREEAPAVLDTVLHTAVRHGGDDARALVHRTGLLLTRTPDGAARFDRRLADLGRRVPGFAARVIGWTADAPQAWGAVVGPGARRTLENIAGVRVPA